jgi:protein TonB
VHAATLDLPTGPQVTPGDRLGLTLCLAIILHAMLVLGVSFVPEPPTRLQAPGLEITLVTPRETPPPDDPDMLAQTNAQGGGSLAEAARPATPVTAPLPSSTPDQPATASDTPTRASFERAPPLEPMAIGHRQPQPKATPDPAPKEAPTVLARPTPERRAEVELSAPEKPEKPREKVREVAAREVAEPQPVPETEKPLVAPAPELAAPEAQPSAQELITRSFAMASMHAELQEKLENKAKRPRTKYVSATTQEFKYAAYMEAWRAKVERIGNINYPDEARRGNLSGALLLDVALKPDGSVLEIIVRRSSGHKVLDDAAVRIVELASPFAPFPDEIRREVDILHVTRTWKFLNTEAFQAQ